MLGKDIIDTDEKVYTITVVIKDTSTDIRKTLDILAEERITIQSMAIHKPTLGDVFLSLTGKQKEARKEDEQ